MATRRLRTPATRTTTEVRRSTLWAGKRQAGVGRVPRRCG